MKIYKTSREIQANIEEVFAAIKDPKRLANWWGPAGFTNTFISYDFRNGGRWSFVMHGPDGQNYPNENIFLEIIPLKMVVIEHQSEPRFQLTITLEDKGDHCCVYWEQVIFSDEIAKNIEHIVVPANEQNLDRLSAHVLSYRGCDA